MVVTVVGPFREAIAGVEIKLQVLLRMKGSYGLRVERTSRN